jgi:glycosyltransferase involved in cell wall biosynthesis
MTQANPLISCIISGYNGERYVREAIDSVFAQSYRPIEVIVADDGSTDGSARAAAEYGDRLRFVTQPTAGPPATRNLGLGAARGELVAFLDADDLWHPEKLERQMARFRSRPELDYCLTHVQLFWIAELREEEAAYRGHPRVQPPGYATTTLLARRALFDRIGAFNPELWFADSADWFTRATEHGAVMEVLPDVMTYRRMHHTNLTRRQDTEGREEWLRFVKSCLTRRRTPVAEG